MVSGSLTDARYVSAKAVRRESPMQIACPDCTTSYQVDPSTLGRTGRSVRCLRCRHVWFAANTEALWAVAKAYRTEVGAPAFDPESLPPAHTVGASTVPAAETADAGPLAPELPAETPPQSPREPRIIAASPPIVPLHPGEMAVRDIDFTDVMSAANRRGKRQQARRLWRLPRPGLSAAILALVVVNAALIAWRADVVRFVPQTASLYARIGLPVNLRDLVFSKITTTTETDDGMAVLVIEGAIASTATRVVDVPDLRFAVRDDGGREIYTWTTHPPKSVLAPGATLAFRSRLAAPPLEGSEILVRFSNRQDRVAGIQ